MTMKLGIRMNAHGFFGIDSDNKERTGRKESFFLT